VVDDEGELSHPDTTKTINNKIITIFARFNEFI